MDRAGKILQRIANIGNGGQVINYRDVTCPNCGAVYQHGDKAQALQKFAQCGAVILRIMEFVEGES